MQLKLITLLSLIIIFICHIAEGCDNYIIPFDAFSYHHNASYDKYEYNNHNYLKGFECEKERSDTEFHSFSFYSYKNSYYNPSKAFLYNFKTDFYNSLFGFSIGWVTGYDEKIYRKGGIKQKTSEYSDPQFIVTPNYYLRYDNLELQLSVIPTKTRIIFLILKIVI